MVSDIVSAVVVHRVEEAVVKKKSKLRLEVTCLRKLHAVLGCRVHLS